MCVCLSASASVSVAVCLSVFVHAWVHVHTYAPGVAVALAAEDSLHAGESLDALHTPCIHAGSSGSPRSHVPNSTSRSPSSAPHVHTGSRTSCLPSATKLLDELPWPVRPFALLLPWPVCAASARQRSSRFLVISRRRSLARRHPWGRTRRAARLSTRNPARHCQLRAGNQRLGMHGGGAQRQRGGTKRLGRRARATHLARRLPTTTRTKRMSKIRRGAPKKNSPWPIPRRPGLRPRWHLRQSHAKFIAVSESPIWLVHMRCDGR